MKRLCCLLMSFVLFFSLFPVASAASTTIPLEPNDMISGSFSAAGETHRYQVTLTTPGAVRIQAEGCSCTAQLFQLNASGSASAIERAVSLPGQSPKYRVPAGSYEIVLSSAAAGAFYLVFYHNSEPGVETEKESNDIPPDATSLAAGASIRGNAQSAIDSDYYHLHLPYSLTLQPSITIPAGSKFYLQLLDADLNVLQRESFSGDTTQFSGEPVRLTAGDYYFRLYPSSNISLFSNDDYVFSTRLPQGPSSWATSELTQAASLGLIPDALQGNYTSPIIRQEFCVLINRMLTAQTGLTLAQLLENRHAVVDPDAFSDTNDPDVLAAHALGIVQGRNASLKQFVPGDSISRQEAAVMLFRAASILGVTEPNNPPKEFSDAIADWARQSVSFVSGMTDASTGNRVMNGTSSTTFSPNATYTREMSFLTVVRLYGAIVG